MKRLLAQVSAKAVFVAFILLAAQAGLQFSEFTHHHLDADDGDCEICAVLHNAGSAITQSTFVVNTFFTLTYSFQGGDSFFHEQAPNVCSARDPPYTPVV